MSMIPLGPSGTPTPLYPSHWQTSKLLVHWLSQAVAIALAPEVVLDWICGWWWPLQTTESNKMLSPDMLASA